MGTVIVTEIVIEKEEIETVIKIEIEIGEVEAENLEKEVRIEAKTEVRIEAAKIEAKKENGLKKKNVKKKRRIEIVIGKRTVIVTEIVIEKEEIETVIKIEIEIVEVEAENLEKEVRIEAKTEVRIEAAKIGAKKENGLKKKNVK